MIEPVIDSCFAGGLGVYDAPEPWGPWTIAFYTDGRDVGPGDNRLLFRPNGFLLTDNRHGSSFPVTIVF